jgi:hydrogenase maturation protease
LEPDSRSSKALILCIGNTLRGDDGVAWSVGDRIERLSLPSVRVIRAFQLLPEHAEEIAASRCVVIVDAEVNLPGGVRIEKLTGKAPTRRELHAVSPVQLAALSGLAYGVLPVVFLCGVPAVDFSHGEGLSAEASNNADAAVRAILDAIGLHPGSHHTVPQ